MSCELLPCTHACAQGIHFVRSASCGISLQSGLMPVFGTRAHVHAGLKVGGWLHIIGPYAPPVSPGLYLISLKLDTMERLFNFILFQYRRMLSKRSRIAIRCARQSQALAKVMVAFNFIWLLTQSTCVCALHYFGVDGARSMSTLWQRAMCRA